MPKQLMAKAKSPMLIIGLFFALSLSHCYQPTTPREVTVAFWTAVAENNLEKARQLTAEQQPFPLDKKLRSALVQTGQVNINYDLAMVETYLTLPTAANNKIFQTWLIRQPKTDQWLVLYQQTLVRMPSAGFQSLIVTLKESGKQAKEQVKTHGKSWLKSAWQGIIKAFAKLKDKTAD
jgi:hypothetical protein